MKDSDHLEPLIEPAVKVLKRIFTEIDATDKELSTARVAASTLSTWSRLKQSERTQEAIYFSMARELATDRNQLVEYVKASLPDVPIAKIIEIPVLESETVK